jgi:Sec-independent protein translocase protein TatA
MNIFGIGPMELVFIGILLLIVFGPKDLQKAGKTVGHTLRKIVRSDTWKMVQQTSKSIKQLPNELIRDADLEEIKKSCAQTSAEIGNLNPGGLSPFHSKPTPGQENDAVLDPPTSEPVSPNKKEGL